MDYPAMRVYLLDDSTREECLVQRHSRSGFEAGAINDVIPSLAEKYIGEAARVRRHPQGCRRRRRAQPLAA
jgi:hypothetical protein